MRSNGRREIGELLRLQRKELVAGLTRLQRARCALARGYESRHLRAVRIEIADDGGLYPHGVLKTRDSVLPARLRVSDQRLIRLIGGSWRIGGRERPVDLLNVIGDALGLGEQLLGTLDRLLELLQR